MDAWQDIRYFMTKETEKWQEAESRLAAVCHENVRNCIKGISLAGYNC